MGPVTLAQDHHDNHACVEHKEYVGFCLLIGRKTSYPVIIAIRYQSLISLKPDPRNPRTHNKKQIQQIARSLSLFGFVNPIIVHRKNRIIAGHGRFSAAKSLSIESVPTITLEDLSEDEIKAYMIADNKLAENAGWDRDILAIELQHLATIQGSTSTSR
jgi:ParB-like chromosome segregation protein Spo0J